MAAKLRHSLSLTWGPLLPCRFSTAGVHTGPHTVPRPHLNGTHSPNLLTFPATCSSPQLVNTLLLTFVPLDPVFICRWLNDPINCFMLWSQCLIVIWYHFHVSLEFLQAEQVSWNLSISTLQILIRVEQTWQSFWNWAEEGGHRSTPQKLTLKAIYLPPSQSHPVLLGNSQGLWLPMKESFQHTLFLFQ